MTIKFNPDNLCSSRKVIKNNIMRLYIYVLELNILNPSHILEYQTPLKFLTICPLIVCSCSTILLMLTCIGTNKLNIIFGYEQWIYGGFMRPQSARLPMSNMIHFPYHMSFHHPLVCLGVLHVYIFIGINKFKHDVCALKNVFMAPQ